MGNEIFIGLISILILIASIIFHEYSHAKVADILGDSTPRLMGRLTLNPLPHIDPIGLILPLLLALSRSPIIFGWAKPVPINPNNFKDPQTGSILVSIAGPVSNFFLAWISALIYRIFPLDILIYVVWINVTLGVFNLIPIPPLDGSHLLEPFIPEEVETALYQYGFLILIALLLFPGTSYIIFAMIQAISKFLIPSL